MNKNHYKLVSFDLDGTIIPGTTSTLHFAKILGVEGRVVELEKQFNKNKITSVIFMHNISKIMCNLTMRLIEEHFHTIPIIGGLAETIKILKKSGVVTVIATTSNKLYAEIFQKKFGFDYIFGTQFELLKDGRSGQGETLCALINGLWSLMVNLI